jgi:hypothetical protein
LQAGRLDWQSGLQRNEGGVDPGPREEFAYDNCSQVLDRDGPKRAAEGADGRAQR